MNQLLNEEQKKYVLNTLNEASEHPVWQKSNLLRVIGKQLCQIRDAFKNLISAPKNNEASTIIPKTETGEDAKEIDLYISLYSAKGQDIKIWEHILTNLPTQLIARPIYTSEENVISQIKSRPNPNNEAYIRVRVSTEHIVPTPVEKTPMDKLQQPLVTIRGRPLSSKYEGTFVHTSGRYTFIDGVLEKL